MINKWLKFNQLLLPQSCVLCTASNGGKLGICHGCILDLPWHHAAQCPQCALPTWNGERCGSCLASTPDFDSTYALFRYEYPLDSMLQRYKYGHHLAMADLFGSLLVEHLLMDHLLLGHSLATSIKKHHMNQPTAGTRSNMPDLLIPMPLHAKRLKERGFNQSLEIARVVSRQLHIPLDTKSCERIKLSPPQASLPFKQRVTNMKGAFRCHHSMDGLNVLLLDDVMTTGASLNALANAVKLAGAARVECCVVARTLR